MTTETVTKMKFNFEPIYKKWPRKEGKGKGMKKLEKSIKTEADFMRLDRSTDNAIALFMQERREKKFIPHWSTFCNNWEDYENAEDLGITPPSPTQGIRVIT